MALEVGPKRVCHTRCALPRARPLPLFRWKHIHHYGMVGPLDPLQLFLFPLPLVRDLSLASVDF